MKQYANVYTVMLAVSLLATLIACLFLFLEFRAYGTRAVPPELRAPTTLPAAPLGAISAAPFVGGQWT